MSHTNKIKDTETHFVIDPLSRGITNSSAANNTIVQYDHNSERFTFEMPRYVDGHDMYESTEVRVHYRNSSNNNLSKTNGVYLPDDLAIADDDENMLTFSWLLSSATTQYIGYLYFSIQFVCLNGETVEYAWNTGVYKDITIIESINNAEEVFTENVDVLTSYRNEIIEEISKGVSDGEDGVSVEHSWDGTTLTITSASGTSSADLKGERGKTGPQGVSGVYVGSGEMPEGYNVQIDPEGDPGSNATVTVDSALSESSENPVQNKVITAAVKENKDAIDTAERVISAVNEVAEETADSLYKHTTNKSNPHSVTAAQVGAPTVQQMNDAIAAASVGGGGGGVSSWNDLQDIPDTLAYIEESDELVEILPDYTITEENMEADMAGIPRLGLVVGNTYTVKLQGTEFVCVAWEATNPEAGLVVGLGDLYTATEGAMGSAPTGEPFVLMELSPEVAGQIGVNVMVQPLVEVPFPVVFSISGKEVIVHKLDNRCLDLGWLPTINYQTVVPLSEYDPGTQIAGGFVPDPGAKVKITYDGAYYECTVFAFGMDNIFYAGNGHVVLESLKNTGEPFALLITPGGAGVYFADGNSHSFSADVMVTNKAPTDLLPYVSETDDGIMKAADKVKLDGVEEGANNYVHPTFQECEFGLYRFKVTKQGHIYMTQKVDDITFDATTKPGKIVAGETFTVDGEEVTAANGAEVFNINNGIITNVATGFASHAEGSHTTALGDYSHAEGYLTTASERYSHAEGLYTIASGEPSHAEGYETVAKGNISHAEGLRTIATASYQHVQGAYNIEDTERKYLHIVGNGKGENQRANAHTLDISGNAWFAGGISCEGGIVSGNTITCSRIYLRSATPGSTKVFQVYVDDTGTLGTYEVNV